MTDNANEIADALARNVEATWGTGWLHLSQDSRHDQYMIALAKYAADSHDEIAELAVVLQERLETKMAQRIVIWDAMGGLYEKPKDGYVVDVEWAAADRSFAEWYKTEEDAQQRMDELAVQHHGHRMGPRAINLTARGCNPSYATVRTVPEFLAVVKG